jgi:RNA polymerase sigma factor (sigma-70 family)
VPTVHNDVGESFVAEYAEKLFYFCLRKCGDADEAEDLTSDITLNILLALRNGAVPRDFKAWVWQIARNRYAKWAEQKRRRRESVSGADWYELDEYDAAEPTPEAELIHAEDLSGLRRELAFIASDYREIVVAHYIDDRTLEDIARSLSLPGATVRSKLRRAREKLKEGMKMSREFGVLSYKPENIDMRFNCSEFPRDGEPWGSMGRRLGMNIALAAYRTPSTAEELAIELGVALPYMEDELDNMARLTLMRKNGNKYETAFFIISAKAQERVNEHVSGLARPLADALTRYLDFEAKCRDAQGKRWYGGVQSPEAMKWARLMLLTDRVKNRTLASAGGGVPGFTLRPNGAHWDCIGLEQTENGITSFIGEHGSGKFGQFRFDYMDIHKLTPSFLAEEQRAAIEAVALQRVTDDVRRETLDELEKLGYIVRVDGEYKPAFMVTLSDMSLPTYTPEQSAELTRLENEAIELAMRQYKLCESVIREEIPVFLKNDAHQIQLAIEQLFFLREFVFAEALTSGWLKYAPAADNRMLGAYMRL